eukprot:jgi/Bigna1/140068/aug1.54_g14776
MESSLDDEPKLQEQLKQLVEKQTSLQREQINLQKQIDQLCQEHSINGNYHKEAREKDGEGSSDPQVYLGETKLNSPNYVYKCIDLGEVSSKDQKNKNNYENSVPVTSQEVLRDTSKSVKVDLEQDKRTVYGETVWADRFNEIMEVTKEIVDENHGIWRALYDVLHKGIFFKLATDVRMEGGAFLYGGPEKPNLDWAAKAAAQELRAADAFFSYFLKHNAPIQVPMIFLIDYRGFRGALVYGSSDGGKTVHNSDSVFDEWMKAAGKHLHLARHNVWGTDLVGGGDLEGHKVPIGMILKNGEESEKKEDSYRRCML